MNNIKLKITSDQLQVVNETWSSITKHNATTPELKTAYDITSKLAVKFKKKFIEKEFTVGDFNITMAYSEAYFLSRTLQLHLEAINSAEMPYEYNVILRIAHFLNQKLA